MAETLIESPAASPAPQAVATDSSHESPGIGKIPRPESTSYRIRWAYVSGFVALHLLAMLAFVPWLFSWTGVVLVFLGNFIFGSLGINLGYHRLLTHRGLIVPRWLERTLAIIGLCNLQDAPARWVGIHRMHHQHSDKRPDPHSPLAGFLWGHVGWLIYEDRYIGTAEFYARYARDLMKDRFYKRLEFYYNWAWVYLAHAAVIFLLGLGAGWLMYGAWPPALQFGASVFVWGVIVRTVYVWHITWAINSVTHVWGYRNYQTTDNSQNNWLLGLTNNGEGWHNNHHAHPRCAAHGHRWWEFDLTYASIRLLEKLGLAKKVVHPTEEMRTGVQES